MKKSAEIAVIHANHLAGLLAAEQAHNAKLEQAAAEWRQRQESAERQARALAAAKNELIRQSETLRGIIHATVKQDEARGGCINGLPQQTDAKMSLRLSDGLARHAPDTAEQAVARPKMEAVLGLLESCKDYAEFEAKLSELDLGKGDNLLIQRLVSDGLSAWADGADDGRN